MRIASGPFAWSIKIMCSLIRRFAHNGFVLTLRSLITLAVCSGAFIFPLGSYSTGVEYQDIGVQGLWEVTELEYVRLVELSYPSDYAVSTLVAQRAAAVDMVILHAGAGCMQNHLLADHIEGTTMPRLRSDQEFTMTIALFLLTLCC